MKKKQIRVTYETRYKELLLEYQSALNKMGKQTLKIIKLQKLLREAHDIMLKHMEFKE
jgi:uncharacterized protein (DUF302 family)